MVGEIAREFEILASGIGCNAVKTNDSVRLYVNVYATPLGGEPYEWVLYYDVVIKKDGVKYKRFRYDKGTKYYLRLDPNDTYEWVSPSFTLPPGSYTLGVETASEVSQAGKTFYSGCGTTTKCEILKEVAL